MSALHSEARKFMLQQAHMGNQPSARKLQEAADQLASVRKVERIEAPSRDDDAVVPPEITDRMLRRVMLFAGVPVVFGFLLYPAFYYLKVRSLVALRSSTLPLRGGHVASR
jgi:hypothetical protein